LRLIKIHDFILIVILHGVYGDILTIVEVLSLTRDSIVLGCLLLVHLKSLTQIPLLDRHVSDSDRCYRPRLPACPSYAAFDGRLTILRYPCFRFLHLHHLLHLLFKLPVLFFEFLNSVLAGIGFDEA